MSQTRSPFRRSERRLDVVEARAFCTAIGIPFPQFIAEFDQEITTH